MLSLRKNLMIPLPTIEEVTDWTMMRCSRTSLLLPTLESFEQAPYNEDRMRQVSESVRLVRDIAASCATPLGACFMCSSYSVRECDVRAIFDLFKTDAERYVLVTLLMQAYDANHYMQYRESLCPQFEHDTAAWERVGPLDVSLMQPLQEDDDANRTYVTMVAYRDTNLEQSANNTSNEDRTDDDNKRALHHTLAPVPFVESTVAWRVKAATQPLVTPTDDVPDVPCLTGNNTEHDKEHILSGRSCDTPSQCLDQYRFVDTRLYELVMSGNCTLTERECATLIIALLYQHP